MAISASGALTLTTVQTEWGGSNPIGMSDYYAGGDNVFSGATDGDGNAIPSTGAIDMSDFYDTTAATPITISSNTNNYNIKTAVQNAGAGLDVPVLLTINSGVTVGSTSTGTPAMKTDTGWSQGVTITITNNGSIVGASGSDTSANPSSGGGNGGGSSSHPNVGGTHPAGQAGSGNSGSAGSSNNGGDAFEHSQTANDYLSVVFATAGTRTGGSAGTATFKGNGGGGGAGGGAGRTRLMARSLPTVRCRRLAACRRDPPSAASRSGRNRRSLTDASAQPVRPPRLPFDEHRGPPVRGVLLRVLAGVSCAPAVPQSQRAGVSVAPALHGLTVRPAVLA